MLRPLATRVPSYRNPGQNWTRFNGFLPGGNR